MSLSLKTMYITVKAGIKLFYQQTFCYDFEFIIFYHVSFYMISQYLILLGKY